MRTPDRWSELLSIEAEFLELETRIHAAAIQDYRQIPPAAFAWHGWDLVSQERIFNMLLPFLRQQVARAKHAMPGIYREHLAQIDAQSILTPQDWFRLPLLSKDDDPDQGLRGFRDKASRNPRLMHPGDSHAAMMAFGSGGSLGSYTPTFVSMDDRAREIHAWRRGHALHGLIPGDIALYTYNTTHKGGQWMQESLLAHGVEVCLRRPEEDPRRVLENIRHYRANALFTVQQPYQALEQQTKAAGINLHSLLMASLENPEYLGLLLPDRDGKRQVEFIFLGGFEVVPYARELMETYLPDTPCATLLGSSEAIPQAASTNPHLTPQGACHYNNLHLLHAPHFIEVVKPQGDAWVPVSKGEQGLLVYTSWARDGTIWLRYAPGDVATLLLDEGECPCGLHSPVISNVARKRSAEQSDLLLAGCAAG